MKKDKKEGYLFGIKKRKGLRGSRNLGFRFIIGAE